MHAGHVTTTPTMPMIILKISQIDSEMANQLPHCWPSHRQIKQVNANDTKRENLENEQTIFWGNQFDS